MIVRLARALAVALCVTAVPAAASSSSPVVPQDPPTQAAPTGEATPASQDSALLNGEVELGWLVDYSAARLGFDVEYEVGQLKERVTIRTPGSLTDAEVWALTNELLAGHGFASVQRPGSRVLSIVKSADAANAARLEKPQDGDERAGFLSVVVKAEHREAKEIVEALKQVLSKPAGSATLLGDRGYILLTDYRARIDQALYVKDLVDAAREPITVETYEVVHLRPTELIGVVTTASAGREEAGGRKLQGKLIAAPDGQGVVITAPARDAPAWQALLSTFDRKAPTETRSYAPKGFPTAEVAELVQQVAKDTGPRGSGERWKVVTDDLTGTLIITATPVEHEEIAALIARLDATPGGTRRQVRTFTVRNRPVADIVAVISELVDSGSIAPEGSSASNQSQDPTAARLGLTPPSSTLQQTPTTAPAAAQSSTRDVLPTGATPVEPAARQTAATQSTQSKTLSATSRRLGSDGQPVVTLTADPGTNTIVVVAEARVLKQVEELLARIDVRQPQVMLDVLVVSLTDDQAIDLGVELTSFSINGSTILALSSLFGLGLAPASPTGPPVPAAGSGFSGAVLNPGDFGVLIRALESLNKGRTLNSPKVLVNNGEAATLTSVLQQPVLATNASSTVSTTSFGGTQDAGTTVTVTPQIAEGDHLILEYSVSVSNFIGDSTNPALPPPRQQNALQSVVTIPDGFTVAVGGLEIAQNTKATTQVPFIGDIPVFGEAFKNRSNTNNRTKFYVFLRANVMRRGGFEDLKYLSERDLEAAGVKDRDFPAVEPLVIK